MTIDDFGVILVSLPFFIVMGVFWWTARKMVKSHKNS